MRCVLIKPGFPAAGRFLFCSFCLATFTVSAQFVDDFNTVQLDPTGQKGWLYRTGAGNATMQVLQGGPGYASIIVDATQDKRGVWWALFERRVDPYLDLTRLQQPGKRLRLEARIRVSHAPRRVNLQFFTQATTNYHSNLIECDIPDTNEWHTISWTPPDLVVKPGDRVTAHTALMDWGLERYRVDVDYIRADIVDLATAGPDQGDLSPYHPPIADPKSFRQQLTAAQDATIDLANPTVNLNRWYAANGDNKVHVLSVDGSRYVLLRWDLSAFAGKKADGTGMLELTTHSVERTSDDISDFGQIRVVEILGGDPAWDRKTVTADSFCRGEPIAKVLNPQMIIDYEVVEGDGGKTWLTIGRPVLQRLLDGKTLGIAIKPLGAIHAAFYPADGDGGQRGPRLLLNVKK